MYLIARPIRFECTSQEFVLKRVEFIDLNIDSKYSRHSSRREAAPLKILGASSNVVGIIYPLAGIGLTDLPKTVGPIAPLAPPPLPTLASLQGI